MAASDSESDLKRKSDRFVKTGEEMLDVLAHDSNRYDLLAEEVASETVLNKILSQWDGNSVSLNDVNRTLMLLKMEDTLTRLKLKRKPQKHRLSPTIDSWTFWKKKRTNSSN